MSDLAFKFHLALLALIFWFFISLMASDIKRKNCGKKYPIDYVLATNLFCEIKSELGE